MKNDNFLLFKLNTIEHPETNGTLTALHHRPMSLSLKKQQKIVCVLYTNNNMNLKQCDVDIFVVSSPTIYPYVICVYLPKLFSRIE
jgi:hypothetical protein